LKKLKEEVEDEENEKMNHYFVKFSKFSTLISFKRNYEFCL